jgi:hypothetical protein
MEAMYEGTVPTFSYALGLLEDILLLKDTSYAVLFREMVSINYWNLIRIVQVNRMAHIFVARIFIFSWHRPVVDKLLNTEYE